MNKTVDTHEGLLIDPSMMLRLRVKADRIERTYPQGPEALPDSAIMPCLSSELAGGSKFSQVRVAIGNDAIFLQADVQGKKQLPWCRDSRLEDSDGLHIWIDTRHSRDVQRPTKYCHRFGFLPMGGGSRADLPHASWVPMERAREHSPQPPANLVSIRSRITEGRYRLVAAIHFDALNGLDRSDFPTIGFYFAVLDRELGCQSLTIPPEMNLVENPSLWAELVL